MDMPGGLKKKLHKERLSGNQRGGFLHRGWYGDTHRQLESRCAVWASRNDPTTHTQDQQRQLDSSAKEIRLDTSTKNCQNTRNTER